MTKELLKQAESWTASKDSFNTMVDAGNLDLDGAFDSLMDCINLIADLAKLIQALSTKVREQEWQPIETATPRDFVILCSHFEGDVSVDTGCVFENKPYLDEGYTVTHWMPLPKPIQDKEQDND